MAVGEHPVNSIVMTCLERLRAIIDDPESGRYTNDWLIRHILRPALDTIISQISNSSAAPVIMSFSVTLDSTRDTYPLPPNIRSVLMLAEEITDTFQTEIIPYDFFRTGQRRWTIQGNSLVFDPSVSTLGLSGRTLSVIYEPSGGHLMHYDPASGPANTEGSITSGILYLAEQPQYGEHDPRVHSYAGATVRVFDDDASTSVTEELWITGNTYDKSTNRWKCTLQSKPQVYPDPATKIHYEVGPPYHPDLVEALALQASIKLGTRIGLPGDHLRALTVDYRSAHKTLMDRISSSLARLPKSFQSESIDSHPHFYWLWGSLTF